MAEGRPQPTPYTTAETREAITRVSARRRAIFMGSSWLCGLD
jgi:hypothetical protein